MSVYQLALYQLYRCGLVSLMRLIPSTLFLTRLCARRTPDGQCLMLASSDGYCSIVVFDELLPLYHTQQHNLQLQTIAQSHSVMTPQPPPSPSLPFVAPSPLSLSIELGAVFAATSSSLSQKRPERPISPPASVVDESGNASHTDSSISELPKKKKRRVELTHHSALS